MKKLLIALLGLILLFLSCKSPQSPEEVLPRASITISLSIDPCGFVWDIDGYFVISDVILAETNGVGCNIPTVTVSFLYNGQLYEFRTLEGGRINAYNTLRVALAGGTQVTYPQLRITINGGDDNGYDISQYADFDIVYY